MNDRKQSVSTLVDNDESDGGASEASRAAALVTADIGLSPIETPYEVIVEKDPKPLGIIAIVAAIVVGVALMAVGIGVLTSTTAEIRIALAVAGLGVLFVAYRGIGQRIAGARFKAGWWLCVGWLVAVAAAALLADFLPIAESKNPSLTFQEPVLAPPDFFSSHPFGTDRQGLDILGGILYGFRVSLIVGLGTVLIGILVGGFVGTIAGFYRRRVDQFVELFTNALLAFPPLILLLGVAAALERNVLNITLALAIVSVPVYVRLARATAIVICQREFVLAGRALGAKNRHLIMKDILPGIVRPLLSYAFVMIAAVIVAEASLSFLGLGIPRPEPTLGNMISAGQTDFDRFPHLVFVPAIALFLTVLCLNQVGEEMQRRWNPRQSKM